MNKDDDDDDSYYDDDDDDDANDGGAVAADDDEGHDSGFIYTKHIPRETTNYMLITCHHELYSLIPSSTKHEDERHQFTMNFARYRNK